MNVGQGSRKVDFLIESDVVHEMKILVPAGKRSKVVNEGLRKKLEFVKRKPPSTWSYRNPIRAEN
jgi:hypothetical protein